MNEDPTASANNLIITDTEFTVHQRNQPKTPVWKKTTVKHAAVAGSILVVGDLSIRAVDLKAWDKLLREAFHALLTQNGPVPALMFAGLIVLGQMYHSAMKRVIQAKDDEIQRLVEVRDKLEERQGLSHPTSVKPGGNKKK